MDDLLNIILFPTSETVSHIRLDPFKLIAVKLLIRKELRW
jgi:hypothetical protein